MKKALVFTFYAVGSGGILYWLNVASAGFNPYSIQFYICFGLFFAFMFVIVRPNLEPWITKALKILIASLKSRSNSQADSEGKKTNSNEKSN